MKYKGKKSDENFPTFQKQRWFNFIRETIQRAEFITNTSLALLFFVYP